MIAMRTDWGWQIHTLSGQHKQVGMIVGAPLALFREQWVRCGPRCYIVVE